MSWIALTEDNVRPLLRLSPAEVDVIKSIVLGGQADTLASIIADLTGEIQGYVQGNPQNSVDADAAKIPGRLKSAAVSVILFRYLNSFQETQSYLTDQRVKEYADAWATISVKVPAGNFVIDPPATASSTEPAVSPSPRITTPCRTFSRQQQDGI